MTTSAAGAPPTLVFAAGGVVWRPTPDGVEVLVVHRPKYDDWSMPKGKRDKGESDEDCARREVEEETGLRCRLGDELISSSYVDHRGRAKLVRYWAMEVAGGAFEPNAEVDEVRWLPPGEASALLSYDRDRQVLASFTDPR
ncbi:MAG TPA: NUDIX hydrolase [Acidimicrobiales bacterium]|nr:NUDIX hydrolase [Acidimicrobiales bacterium]